MTTTPKIMDKNNPFNYLFYMLTIFVIGSLLFLVGFFPVSTNLIGKNGQHYDNIVPTQLEEYT